MHNIPEKKSVFTPRLSARRRGVFFREIGVNFAKNQHVEFDGARYALDQGLTSEQAAASRAKYGRNELTPPKRKPWWLDLLERFDDPTIKILLAAAALSLISTAVARYALNDPDATFVDTIGVFVAVALATLAGFFSERKSAKEFEALNKIKDDVPVRVYRDGQIAEIHIGDLVVGDLVVLEPGDRAPADGVMLVVSELRVDESTFTGESFPVAKAATQDEWNLSTLAESAKLGSKSFVARGSAVCDGRGRLLVTSVGDATELGKIAGALEASALDEAETPLMQKLARLAKQISVVGVVAATAIFTVMNLVYAFRVRLVSTSIEATTHGTFAALVLVALVLGHLVVRFCAKPFFKSMGTPIKSPFVAFCFYVPCALAALFIVLALRFIGHESSIAFGLGILRAIILSFVVAVTIIVVAVPEGLPMMVAVSLALNGRKMARENCLARKLVASETIGSATVVCTDKTGTLTENKMKPAWVSANGRDYSREEFYQLAESPVWRELVDGIAVDSRAELHFAPNPDLPERPIVTNIGNPTEGALLRFLYDRGLDYRRLRGAVRNRLYDLEHNSDRKFSAAVVEEEDGRVVAFMKGAPERILERCSTIMIDGERRPIAEYRDQLLASLEKASEGALRVLGFCQRVLDSRERELFEKGDTQEKFDALRRDDYVFVAFLGIADPPRAEALDAVRLCQGAGIQVKMVTGDARPTAVAVAKEVGIYTGGADELALDSEEFAKISDAELPEIAEKIRILARSTPSDKLRLVQALHRDGEVVAMTGDGTNDAPALKAADVGISMGISGSEVAKEASDIVLVDDNFKSVATGVWWGRSIFQNIRRFLQFQLSVNFVALAAATIGPLVGVPLPLTVAQLLWINVIMDTFAALALSTDPPRPSSMRRPPIPRGSHIVTSSMGLSILVAGIYQTAILFAALFGGWFVVGAEYSSTATEAQNLEALTLFFTILVMFQFWHKFNCRSLSHDESPFALLWKNRPFLVIIFSITATQIIMVQLPAVGKFFRTVPLELWQWIQVTALTSTIIPVAWFGRRLAGWLGLEKNA